MHSETQNISWLEPTLNNIYKTYVLKYKAKSLTWKKCADTPSTDLRTLPLHVLYMMAVTMTQSFSNFNLDLGFKFKTVINMRAGEAGAPEAGTARKLPRTRQKHCQ